MLRAKKLTFANMSADMEKLTESYDKARLHRDYWRMYQRGYIRRKDWILFEDVYRAHDCLTRMEEYNLEV